MPKDGYTLWKEAYDAYAQMSEIERLRWHLKNDCTCQGHLEEWDTPAGHYTGCPLHNPDCETWLFYEGHDQGFVFPS